MLLEEWGKEEDEDTPTATSRCISLCLKGSMRSDYMSAPTIACTTHFWSIRWKDAPPSRIDCRDTGSWDADRFQMKSWNWIRRLLAWVVVYDMIADFWVFWLLFAFSHRCWAPLATFFFLTKTTRLKKYFNVPGQSNSSFPLPLGTFCLSSLLCPLTLSFQ